MHLYLSLAAAACIAFIPAVSAATINEGDQTHTFSTADAEPVDPALLDTLAANATSPRSFVTRQTNGLAAHRLKPGRGLVLGYRFYTPGVPAVMDNEFYRKITIWLPDGLPVSAMEFDLARDKVLVMQSRGQSGWSFRDCSGSVGVGRLQVRPTALGHEVTLVGQFTPKGSIDACKAESVELVFNAPSMPFDALTSWLGGTADSPFSGQGPM